MSTKPGPDRSVLPVGVAAGATASAVDGADMVAAAAATDNPVILSAKGLWFPI